MKAFRTLLAEQTDPGILRITLNRPERLNAIDEEMITELHHAVSEIEKGCPETYRAVILSGAGRGFCSGGDLAAFQAKTQEDKKALKTYISKFHWFAQRWYELPLPTIACLHGHAAGGGAALSLLCDIRLAAPDTSIRFSFSRMGLIPDLGSHYLLPQLLGRAKALELLYLGTPVAANEALDMGLVNQVLPAEQLEQRAMEMAQQLASGPFEVFRICKQLLQQGMNSSLAEVLELEIMHQTNRFKSEEFQIASRQFFGLKK
ncbi:enoyl-CoA hydratase/isomerase family protein [Brevibacillus massiliensis]|uniref:enoyl-CoA hydratase/isomerase family protein n=1 Tax=Brevibacillus massiliensis TaxID=1118054 RepID=UPI0002FBA308|nr:enoyl-CoA hydratase/isomerase family protein [Brevibacillus massiliensis]